MNFVRKITHSDTLKHIVDLPESLRDQDVELIILPLHNSYSDKEQPSYVSGSSVRGMLRQYAKRGLMQNETDAWQKGVKEKHEHR